MTQRNELPPAVVEEQRLAKKNLLKMWGCVALEGATAVASVITRGPLGALAMLVYLPPMVSYGLNVSQHQEAAHQAFNEYIARQPDSTPDSE